jgi:hypothetical protein
MNEGINVKKYDHTGRDDFLIVCCDSGMSNIILLETNKCNDDQGFSF